MSKKTSGRGFTLIELLVVIAIIGILSSVVLASLTSARRKARDARRISDIKQIQLALELYADDNSGSYPTDLYGSGATDGLSAGGYMTVVPEDPASEECNTGSSEYCFASEGTDYHLGAKLENPNAVPDNDVDCNSTASLVCFSAVLTNGTAFDGNSTEPDETIQKDDVIYDQRS